MDAITLDFSKLAEAVTDRNVSRAGVELMLREAFRIAAQGTGDPKSERRQARVVLGPKQVVELLAGRTVYLRLHNVAGEEQIVELTSDFKAARERWDAKRRG